MPDNLPSLTSQVLALLDNAKRLCIGRQQRPLAKDVIVACKLLVAGTVMEGITPLLDELELAIPGKMAGDLMDMFIKTAKTVMTLSPK